MSQLLLPPPQLILPLRPWAQLKPLPPSTPELRQRQRLHLLRQVVMYHRLSRPIRLRRKPRPSPLPIRLNRLRQPMLRVQRLHPLTLAKRRLQVMQALPLL